MSGRVGWPAAFFAFVSAFASSGCGGTPSFAVESGLQSATSPTRARIDDDGAVIAGRIVDRMKRPVKDVQVVLLAKDVPSGQYGVAGRGTITDGSGAFRLGGLTAGRYFLCGMPPSRQPNAPPSEYAPTCYPGTTTVADAQAIIVRPAETRDTSFVMVGQMRLATISGIARDAMGQPLSDGTVLLNARVGFPLPLSGRIQPNGSFTIPDVPSGEYVLRMPEKPRAAGAQYIPDVPVAAVTVTGDDVSGVVMEPVKAVTVSGRLIVPPGVAESLQSRFIRIGAIAATAKPLMAPPPAAPVVNPDLTFRLITPALPTFFQVLGAGPLMMKAVRIGGRNVIDSPTDLQPGRDLSGVEIELMESPSLTATAIAAGGVAANDWCFLVFPQDANQWTTRDFLGHSFAILWHIDARPFTIRSLAPGRYYGVALNRFDNQWRDPDFLNMLRPRAFTFELANAERKTLRLPLVTLP